MTDIIVVGGGIAGLSAAARLAPHAKVTLLEQESSTGYHTSGRSAALFEENYGLPSTVALNTASKDYHNEANGGYLSPRGFLIIGPLFSSMSHQSRIFTSSRTIFTIKTKSKSRHSSRTLII